MVPYSRPNSLIHPIVCRTFGIQNNLIKQALPLKAVLGPLVQERIGHMDRSEAINEEFAQWLLGLIEASILAFPLPLHPTLLILIHSEL